MRQLPCKQCGRTLPEDRFDKNKGFATGRRSRCKECVSDEVRKHKQDYISKHHDAIVARDRLRWPKRRATHKRARRGNDDPYKRRCRMALRDAVKSGKVKKPLRCSECQWVGRLHGHHNDYSKPLEVIWVCPICHGKIHRKYA